MIAFCAFSEISRGNRCLTDHRRFLPDPDLGRLPRIPHAGRHDESLRLLVPLRAGSAQGKSVFLLGCLSSSGGPLLPASFRAIRATPAAVPDYLLRVLLANLGLLYEFCRRLSNSREVGALACLIGAYHAHLADLYYGASTIYDLLCYFFYFLVFVRYLKIRERGLFPTWGQTVTLLVLYICSLNSKEMAVTLPVLALIYELIYHPPRHLSRDAWRSMLAGHARFLGVSVVVTAIYIIGKTHGPERMTGNAAYAPHIALRPFLNAWTHYLFDLFYGAISFNDFKVVLALLLPGAVALAARSRELLFAWLFIVIGVLPIIFIEPRGFFVMYMTLPGWYLFAAKSLVLLRDFLLRNAPRVTSALRVRPREAALFAIVAAVLLPLHWRQRPLGNAWAADAYGPLRSLNEQLTQQYPSLPHGARILFLSEPYPAEDWMLTFLFRLHYRDGEIQVDRAKRMPAAPNAAAMAAYQHVFTLENGRLTEVSR